jgi:hypothetical protein
MTLTIRSILLSLSALLVTGTLTACDSAEEFEALGVDIEDLEDMSDEELDALPCLDEPDLTTPPPTPLPPLPRPPAPERKLVAVDQGPFFAHPADLLASDKLGLPDGGDDEGCDSNGDDDLDLAAN